MMFVHCTILSLMILLIATITLCL